MEAVARREEVSLCLRADFVARHLLVRADLVIEPRRCRARVRELRASGNPRSGLFSGPASRSSSTFPRGSAISWCYCYARVRVDTRLVHRFGHSVHRFGEETDLRVAYDVD
jgi:hypothetical protein